MTRLFITALVAVASLAAAPVRAADWTVDTAKSQIGFSGTQTGTPFKGRFERFNAAIRLDPAHPEAARIVVAVDLASAKTGDSQRDTALPTADWFDIAHARVARFAANGVRKTGTNSFVAQGQLTLRGQTRPVSLPFTLQINGKTAHAVGHARLTRTAFGVGQGQWASGQWVALEVGVDIDITAQSK
jgi:polyisoprenoid-binding protein YceI